MQLLSLKKNIDDLDRMDRERRDIYAAIGDTIRVVSETAIRFDDEQTNRHKVRLNRLAEQLHTSPRELLSGVQREFKIHQVSYQGEAEEYIHALQANLTSTARLLQEMMANVDVRGSNHQEDLGKDIQNLQALQQLEDLAQLKLELGSVASRMAQSLDELKREHQMMVAQMRDELQALHRELANRKMPPQPPPPPRPAAPTASGPATLPASSLSPVAPPVVPVAEPAASVSPTPIPAVPTPVVDAGTPSPVAGVPASPGSGSEPLPLPPATPPTAPAEPSAGAHYSTSPAVNLLESPAASVSISPSQPQPEPIPGLELAATELAALNVAVANPAPPPAPTPAPAPPEQFGMPRRDLENMILMKVESTETFCLMIVWLRNLPMLFNKHQPDEVLETMNAAARRLGKTLVGNPLWSKWEDDSFVVFVGQPKANAQKASKEIVDKLNAVYLIESPNGPVEVALRVAAGVVDRTKGETADHLLGRAQQLIKNLRAMP